MKAYCKICKTIIYPTSDFEFGVMALSHIMQYHFSHPSYSELLEKIIEQTKNDFIIEKDGRKMEIWTIYKHPLDYPEKFVARKFIFDKPTSEILIGDTLEEIRKLLPGGLTRIERDPKDDPVIVEAWIG